MSRLDLYSGGIGFELRPDSRLSVLRYFVVYRSPSSRILRQCLGIVLPLPNPYLIAIHDQNAFSFDNITSADKIASLNKPRISKYTGIRKYFYVG
jgi:hypothetical protein